MSICRPARGRDHAAALLAEADVVVNNHRVGALERQGLSPDLLAERHPGLVYVSVSCYGSVGPWAGRGGFDMNGSAASGLMAIEGTTDAPRLPVTGLINDYITGYMGAVGASAALVTARHRGRLLARHRQLDQDRDVVRVARPGRPGPGRL